MKIIKLKEEIVKSLFDELTSNNIDFCCDNCKKKFEKDSDVYCYDDVAYEETFCEKCKDKLENENN